MPDSLPDRIVIALPEELRPGFHDAVRAVAPNIELALLSNEEPLPDLVADSVAFYRSWALQRRVVDEVLDRARSLRWMHVPSAGVDVALTPNVMERDFVITHVKGVYDAPVAEFALGLILAAAKMLPTYLAAQREGHWLRAASWDEVQKESTLPQMLAGQTVGLLGFGGTGTRLAELLRPFGVRIVAMRRDPRPDARADAVYGPDRLGEVLAESDFVVLALPLTRETERIIDAEALARMKPSAWLVNVSRGRLVDDDALMSALAAGRIAGAALDVFSREPLPTDHPYYRLPNVILTPHVAGAFPTLNEADRDIFVEDLRRFIVGEPLKYVVDRVRGY